MKGQKSVLRKAMRETARWCSEDPRKSQAILAGLHQWKLWQQAQSIAAFAALPGEPNLLAPWPQGKKIALPRIKIPRSTGVPPVNSEMSFHFVTDPSALVVGTYGILEPPPEAEPAGCAFDIILVPGLAFDRQGGRLGRGSGFYDRFLATVRGVRIGVCFDEQIVDEVPSEPHDSRVDFLLSPEGVGVLSLKF